MAIVFGERFYGRVDAVPGLFYVSTLFEHIQFLPISAKRSYVILEGSEDGHGFQGKVLPLQWHSVRVGYLRGWLSAIAMVGAGIAGFVPVIFFLGYTGHVPGVAGLTTIAGAFYWIFYIVTRPQKQSLPAQKAFYGVSLALLMIFFGLIAQNPGLLENGTKLREIAFFLPALAAANVAIFYHNRTHRWDFASPGRALQLAEKLDLDKTEVARHLRSLRR